MKKGGDARHLHPLLPYFTLEIHLRFPMKIPRTNLTISLLIPDLEERIPIFPFLLKDGDKLVVRTTNQFMTLPVITKDLITDHFIAHILQILANVLVRLFVEWLNVPKEYPLLFAHFFLPF